MIVNDAKWDSTSSDDNLDTTNEVNLFLATIETIKLQPKYAKPRIPRTNRGAIGRKWKGRNIVLITTNRLGYINAALSVRLMAATSFWRRSTRARLLFRPLIHPLLAATFNLLYLVL